MSNECGCQCGQAHGACATEYQYAVKILCGEVKAVDGQATPVAPGRYWTATNIHNPDKCKDAHFRLKVGVALQNLESPVSQYIGDFPLHPDGMLEIDCSLIRALVQLLLYPPPQSLPPFIKGYLVLESDVPLDVVAVYSGSTGPCAANSFHTERVPATCLAVCEDFVLPLHTGGIAVWQTVAPSAGPLGPAVPVVPTHSGWGPPPFGSQWISQLASHATTATQVGTTLYYELCFNLCSGFRLPSMSQTVQVISDDTSQVFLNGTQMGATIPYNTATPLTIPVGALRTGRNCFQVRVTNTNAVATGFALAGVLSVPRGKCPCAPLPIVIPSRGVFGRSDVSTWAAFAAQTEASARRPVDAGGPAAGGPANDAGGRSQ